MAGMIVWQELVDVDGTVPDEPAAPAIVTDQQGTVWARPLVPGRPDLWYRVGSSRGASELEWKTLLERRPLFLAWRHDVPDADPEVYGPPS